MDPFKDKIAIVTGGGSGIGEALCLALGQRAAVVVVTDIDGGRAERVAGVITQRGGRAAAITVDVADAVAVQHMVDDTIARHGRLDYLFNNAGIAIVGDMRDMTLAHWQRILAVNLFGVVHGVAAAYPHMVTQGSGHIVNTASMAGLIPCAMLTAYATTKHAVVGLSVSLRTEAAALGVRVSAACPGFIQTGIFEASTYLGFKQPDLLAAMPVKPYDADRCAAGILRGVARNQAIIIVPAYTRLFWWINRLCPALLLRLTIRMAAQVRRLRQDACPSAHP